MYTQCPSCATVFAVTPEQLQMAEGEVRCGLCNEVFMAVDVLVDRLPEPRSDAAPSEVKAGAKPAAAPRTVPLRERPARAAVDWVERVLGLETDGGTATARSSRRQLGYTLAALVLLLGLVVQYGYFNSVSLAHDPQLRPYVARLCAVAGCPVPPRRAPDRIAIVDRTVRSHPAISGALLVEATLRNEAPFRQPLPQVQLTLRAMNGRVTGQRWFTPEEYLAPGQDSLATGGLAPGQDASLRLEVVDPGGGTQNFEFDFR